ncbi:hypothetical protein BUE80_DR005389 [Diplocarpon rosae]|nr:hypothetical protein BUE80_DR005389 [Diplocarpon rosae]
MEAPESTCFPRLPIELQLQIWECVVIEPSIITVHSSRDLLGDEELQRPYKADFTCRYRIPAIFHACRNSRQIALKSHPLLFGGNSISGAVFGSPMPFNTDKDVLLFHARAAVAPFVLSAFRKGFESICHLAIRIASDDTTTSLIDDLLAAFRNGSNIRHIYLIREEPAGINAEQEDQLQELSNECLERNLLPGYMIRLFIMKDNGRITAMESLDLIHTRNFSVVSREEFEKKWRRVVRNGSVKFLQTPDNKSLL